MATDKKTTKVDKTSAGNPIESSSPYGHEELEQITIAEQMGTSEAPEKNQGQKKTPPVHDAPMPQNRNPKHTARNPREQ